MDVVGRVRGCVLSVRGLLRLVLRRLGVAAVTLLVLAFLLFLAFDVMPGDRLGGAGPDETPLTLDPATRAALLHARGLDRPLLVRFAAWCGAAFTLDLGTSRRTGRPVADEIAERLPATLELNAAALLVMLGLGLPLGWRAARRAGGPFDRGSGALLLALYAAPSFWIALALQSAFAVHWRLLPLYGRSEPSGAGGPLDRLQHLVLPALCLAAHGLAFYAQCARNGALAGLLSRHAATARTLGLSERRVFTAHALRPSALSLVSLLGLMIPALAGGSVVIETVFAWPGVGSLLFARVKTHDAPVVLGLALLTACLTIAGSLLADVLALWADPRTRGWGGEVPS